MRHVHFSPLTLHRLYPSPFTVFTLTFHHLLFTVFHTIHHLICINEFSQKKQSVVLDNV